MNQLSKTFEMFASTKSFRPFATSDLKAPMPAVFAKYKDWNDQVPTERGAE